jgi:hypothetical protein
MWRKLPGWAGSARLLRPELPWNMMVVRQRPWQRSFGETKAITVESLSGEESGFLEKDEEAASSFRRLVTMMHLREKVRLESGGAEELQRRDPGREALGWMRRRLCDRSRCGPLRGPLLRLGSLK